MEIVIQFEDLLDVLVLHSEPAPALLALVIFFVEDDLIHDQVVDVDIPLCQLLHQIFRLGNAQEFRDAHSNESRKFWIPQDDQQFLDILLKLFLFLKDLVEHIPAITTENIHDPINLVLHGFELR